MLTLLLLLLLLVLLLLLLLLLLMRRVCDWGLRIEDWGLDRDWGLRIGLGLELHHEHLSFVSHDYRMIIKQASTASHESNWFDDLFRGRSMIWERGTRVQFTNSWTSGWRFRLKRIIHCDDGFDVPVGDEGVGDDGDDGDEAPCRYRLSSRYCFICSKCSSARRGFHRNILWLFDQLLEQVTWESKQIR